MPPPRYRPSARQQAAFSKTGCSSKSGMRKGRIVEHIEWRTIMAVLRVALLCLLCTGTCLREIGDSSDEQAIKNVFATFSASWNQPGMPGFGDLFTEDADFVAISGKWMKGRDEIVSYHKDLLAKRYNGSHSFTDSIT